ncbi:MAG: hypothetical protein EBS29_06215 [Chloroflexia bacterium]|nr:hypothetical protein [Chloroflexia bacterium]
MPQAMYCSSCGQLLVRTPPHWSRRGMARVLWSVRVLVLCVVCGFILRATLPLALRIAPACTPGTYTLALIPRQVGVIDSTHGLVGSQPFLQTGDCHQGASAWYSITTNQDLWFAAAQRNPHTWAGWLIIQIETGLHSLRATSTQWLHRGMDFVMQMIVTLLNSVQGWDVPWRNR